MWQVSIHFSKDAAAEGLSSWQRDVGAHVRTATGGLDSPHEQLSAGGDVTGDGEYGPCVAILGRGETFGEASLVTGAKRNATVVAAQATLLGVVEKGIYERTLSKVSTFLVLPPALRSELQRAPEARGKGEGAALAALLRTHSFFAHMSPSIVEALCATATLEQYQAHSMVYRADERADKIYFVVSGSVSAHNPEAVERSNALRGKQGETDEAVDAVDAGDGVPRGGLLGAQTVPAGMLEAAMESLVAEAAAGMSNGGSDTASDAQATAGHVNVEVNHGDCVAVHSAGEVFGSEALRGQDASDETSSTYAAAAITREECELLVLSGTELGEQLRHKASALLARRDRLRRLLAVAPEQRSEETVAEIGSLLMHNPFVSRLSADARRDICRIITLQTHSPGDVVVRQFELGAIFYVILSGSVSVHQVEGDYNAEVGSPSPGRGSSADEGRSPRESASSGSAANAISMPRSSHAGASPGHRGRAGNFAEPITVPASLPGGAPLRALTSVSSAPTTLGKDVTAALSSNTAAPPRASAVATRDRRSSTPTELHTLRSAVSSFGKCVQFLVEGDSFGEAAITAASASGEAAGQRNASIICQERTELLAVPRQAYERSLRVAQDAQLTEKLALLAQIPSLAEWPRQRLTRLTYSMALSEHPRGARIVRQGELCDVLRIVRSGTAKLVSHVDFDSSNPDDTHEGAPQGACAAASNSTRRAAALEVAVLGAGELLGEWGVLHKRPQSSSAIVSSASASVYSIPVEDFLRPLNEQTRANLLASAMRREAARRRREAAMARVRGAEVPRRLLPPAGARIETPADRARGATSVRTGGLREHAARAAERAAAAEARLRRSASRPASRAEAPQPPRRPSAADSIRAAASATASKRLGDTWQVVEEGADRSGLLDDAFPPRPGTADAYAAGLSPTADTLADTMHSRPSTAGTTTAARRRLWSARTTSRPTTAASIPAQGRAAGRRAVSAVAASRAALVDLNPPPPSRAEVELYARQLGLDPDEDPELLFVAEQALASPQPAGLRECHTPRGRLRAAAEGEDGEGGGEGGRARAATAGAPGGAPWRVGAATAHWRAGTKRSGSQQQQRPGSRQQQRPGSQQQQRPGSSTGGATRHIDDGGHEFFSADLNAAAPAPAHGPRPDSSGATRLVYRVDAQTNQSLPRYDSSYYSSKKLVTFTREFIKNKVATLQVGNDSGD